MADEPPSISGRDWRLQGITTLVEDFVSPWTGIVHKAGSVVEIAGFVSHHGGLLQIPLPNPSAMYLSLARRAADQGNELLNRNPNIRFETMPDGSKKLSTVSESDFFTALESLVACIVFSYTAIEAFANASIPDDLSLAKNHGKSKEWL